MTKTEELHNAAIKHLAESRQAMRKLMAVSDDWTATTMLEIDFESLEHSVQEFGRHQLLLSCRKSGHDT